MDNKANGAGPDGSTSSDDRAADQPVPTVTIIDPVTSIIATLGRLAQLAAELRSPSRQLIDLTAVARGQLADQLDGIIAAAGGAWPAGARFAHIRIERDDERFDITLDGVPFPYALNSAEEVTVTQAAGSVSTVSLPVLCESVYVRDRVSGAVASIGPVPAPPVYVDHPQVKVEPRACPAHGPHPHAFGAGPAGRKCLDCPRCAAEDTADDRDEPADPTVDPNSKTFGDSADLLAAGFADDLPPVIVTDPDKS